jgi:oligoribonuclease
MSVSKREMPTWLVWLDLETTGSNEDEDCILELGFLVTDEELKVKSEHAYTAYTTHEEVEAWRATVDPVVRDMHERNGLWDAIEEPDALPLALLETEAISVFQSLGNRHDFILCGSGVSHFDRRFLKEHLPRFERWFRYYSIDVGVLRRSLELIGRTDALLAKQEKAHRALDDARYHLEEMRHIKSVLGAAP